MRIVSAPTTQPGDGLILLRGEVEPDEAVTWKVSATWKDHRPLQEELPVITDF